MKPNEGCEVLPYLLWIFWFTTPRVSRVMCGVCGGIRAGRGNESHVLYLTNFKISMEGSRAFPAPSLQEDTM